MSVSFTYLIIFIVAFTSIQLHYNFNQHFEIRGQEATIDVISIEAT